MKFKKLLFIWLQHIKRTNDGAVWGVYIYKKPVLMARRNQDISESSGVENFDLALEHCPSGSSLCINFLHGISQKVA